MTDIYLRFAIQQDALDALRPLDMTYLDEDGIERISQAIHQWAICEAGEMHGKYHLNIRVLDDALDMSALKPYQVFPKTPSTIWA